MTPRDIEHKSPLLFNTMRQREQSHHYYYYITQRKQ